MPIALLSALILTLAPTPGACGPDLLAPRAQAREVYTRGDFSLAARRFHDLWLCSHDPRDLVNAVQSYHLAGRLAEALDLWSAVGSTVHDRELAARGHEAADAARAHTSELHLELAVEGTKPPGSAVVTLCRATPPGAPPDCGVTRQVDLSLRQSRETLRLDRGAWQLRVRWGERDIEERDLLVRTGPTKVRLVRRPLAPPRRAVLGLLVPGALLSGAGLGLAALAGQNQEFAAYYERVPSGSAGIPLRTTAAALGGAGLGLLTGGTALALTASPRVRRFGAVALPLGALALGAGAGLRALGGQRLRPAHDSAGLDRLLDVSGEMLAGGLALGLGAGLLAGGIVALAANRPAPRPRTRYGLAPALSRGFAGLVGRVAF